MGQFYVSDQYDIGSFNKNTPLTKADVLWLVGDGFSLTKAQAAVKANILAEVALGNLTPIFVLQEETKDTEDNITRYENGSAIKNFEGKRGSVYTLAVSLEAQKKLRTFNGKNPSMFIGDINGNIKFTSSDGTSFEPFTTSYFNVSTQKWGAGHTTMIEVVMANNEEWDSNGYFFKPVYTLNSIKPVIPVEIVTQTTVAATIFSVKVAFVSNSEMDNAGVDSQYPLQELLKENFRCYNTAAPTVPLTPSSITESTTEPGLYAVTVATFTGGPCSIVPTSVNLYKSPAVTIVSV